jgi:hypothetical protein
MDRRRELAICRSGLDRQIRIPSGMHLGELLGCLIQHDEGRDLGCSLISRFGTSELLLLCDDGVRPNSHLSLQVSCNRKEGTRQRQDAFVFSQGE